MGISSSNTICGALAEVSSVTVSGPPERIIPLGLKFLIKWILTSYGTNSQ